MICVTPGSRVGSRVGSKVAVDSGIEVNVGVQDIPPVSVGLGEGVAEGIGVSETGRAACVNVFGVEE